MDDRRLAEEWVQAQLVTAREAFRRHPPGLHDSSLEQYEEELRRRADAIRRPTDQYLGLVLEAAEAAAYGAGDDLCVHRGSTGHRADWRADRVHVELDVDDRVRTARRDPAPWQYQG